MMNHELKRSNDNFHEQLRVTHPKLDSIKIIRIQLIEKLHLRIEKLIESCGGYTEYGMLFDPYAKNTVNQYLIKNKEAEKMQYEINNLILNFKSSFGITWKPIKDAKDIKIFKNDPHQRNKTFSTLNFEDRNLYHVINTFEQLELSILIEEQKILLKYFLNKKSI